MKKHPPRTLPISEIVRVVPTAHVLTLDAWNEYGRIVVPQGDVS